MFEVKAVAMVWRLSVAIECLVALLSLNNSNNNEICPAFPTWHIARSRVPGKRRTREMRSMACEEKLQEESGEKAGAEMVRQNAPAHSLWRQGSGRRASGSSLPPTPEQRFLEESMRGSTQDSNNSDEVRALSSQWAEQLAGVADQLFSTFIGAV
jgi:hypothetical protein